MFEVMIHNGQNSIPDQDVYYVIGKDGIYLKKNLGLIESLAPVKKIPGLEEVTCFATMSIAKIPGHWFAKVYEFFKEVHNQYKAEAVVLLFYNQDSKKYKIVAPAQKVSGAACDYNKGMNIKDMTMIGTIHSHSSMSAFHSGTDDTDEKVFDGLHITIGNVNDEFPSISTSIVANGFRQICDSHDYIESLENVIAENTVNVVYQRNNKRFKINVAPSKSKFNQKWLDMVEQKYPVHTYSSSYNYNHYKHQQSRLSKLWDNIQSSKVEDKTFKPSTDPCLTCVHKKYNTFEDLYGVESEESKIYECGHCEELFEIEDDDVIQCPNCLLDDNIIEIDDTDKKKDNYENKYQVSNVYFNTITPKLEPEDVYTTCPECANTFMYDELKPICPFCYKEIEVKRYNREDEVEEQVQSNSGPSWIGRRLFEQFKKKGIDLGK